MIPVITTFIEAGGLRFEVDTCGEGDRLALCLHGFPESSYSWRHQLPLLAGLGYRAWAPNLRGYGRTSRPSRVADYALDRLVGDVAALIDAAGARNVTLIGHDWGAAVAWVFAADRVRDLERLVIMNVPHPACFVRELRTPMQLLRSWYIAFFQLPWLPEAILGCNGAAAIARVFPAQIPAAAIDVYRRNAAQPGALRAMLAWYRALARDGRRFATRAYPPIDVPTLVIWGTGDIALGIATTRGTEAYVRDLTLRYLPGVSHWVQQVAPQTVNTMLTAFLTSQDVPRVDKIR